MDAEIDQSSGRKICLCGVAGCTQELALIAEGLDGYDEWQENLLSEQLLGPGTLALMKDGSFDNRESGDQWRFCLLLSPLFSRVGSLDDIATYAQNQQLDPIELDAAQAAMERYERIHLSDLQSEQRQQEEERNENLRPGVMRMNLPFDNANQRHAQNMENLRQRAATLRLGVLEPKLPIAVICPVHEQANLISVEMIEAVL